MTFLYLYVNTGLNGLVGEYEDQIDSYNGRAEADRTKVFCMHVKVWALITKINVMKGT